MFYSIYFYEQMFFNIFIFTYRYFIKYESDIYYI